MSECDVDPSTDFKLPLRAINLELGVNFLSTRLIFQKIRHLLEPAVPASQFSEDFDSGVRMEVVEGYWLEQIVQGVHEIAQDGCHGRIQELGCQVVDTQLERSETLIDEVWTGVEGVYKGFHEIAQMRQQIRKPDRHRQAKFHKQVALGWLGVRQEVIEGLEHFFQNGQDFFV